MTYQERIHDLANRMAAAEGIKRATYPPSHFRIILNRFENYAKVAIADMELEYEFAYFSNFPHTKDHPDYALWNENCMYEMRERGLIN